MVRKKNSVWRPCRDYIRFIQCTVPDCYPIPLISDAQTSLTGCKVFSVIDLKAGYNQIPMDRRPLDRRHNTLWTLGVEPNALCFKEQ